MITRLLVPLIALALVVPRLAAQDPVPPAPPPVPAPPAPPAAPATPRIPKSSSTLINSIDIEKLGSSVANAYDVVRVLRPRWLRPEVQRLQGGSVMPQIHVYVDDRDMGEVEYLRSIPAEHIFTLRFMSTTEVGARFGPASGPGIVVTLKS